MLSTSFLVGIRNLLRHRYYTLLNVVGLAVGLACALLIWVFVRFESSFDLFHTHPERIYRVVTELRFEDHIGHQSGVHVPFPEVLRTDFPEVKVTQLSHYAGSQVTVLDEQKNATPKMFREEVGVFFLEPEFFKIFNFSFLQGNPKATLSAPNQAVLTQKAAEQYFGSWQTAVGKFIQIDDKTLQVSGILQNPPANTNFPLKVLVSFATMENYVKTKGWDGIDSDFQGYVALPENMSAKRFQQLLTAAHDKNVAPPKITFPTLQPLTDIHFNQEYDSFTGSNISRQTLWLFTGIGVFLIIMACVNFINLATALAAKRSKEIGVRKVLGGSRWQLFRQLLTETGLVVLVAMVLALALAYQSFPWLKQLLKLPETLPLFSGELLLFALGIIGLVTLLAGTYPALVLSGFQPILALKSKGVSQTVGGVSLRKALVVVQFSISQVLIVGTILVINQMNFVRNQDLGFQKDALVFLRMDSDSLSQLKFRTFKEQLLQNPQIQQASYSRALPSDMDFNSSWGIEQFDNKSLPAYLEPQVKLADTAYFRTYGLQLLAGRKYQAADTLREVVVNETFLRKVGIQSPEQAIGKTLRFYGGPALPIVGVVKDFNNQSLHNEISPIVMSTLTERYQTLSLKISTQNMSQTLGLIKQQWQQTFPQKVFDYQFVDDKLAQYYAQDEKMLRLFKAFAGVAIFISCLGLFGLMAFTAQQRTKEIGVRKVLGATVTSIVSLLSRDFLKLVLLANVIAWPLAWWGMQTWLQNFEYRTSITWWIFGIGGALAILISLATISFQAIKAAVANPVNALRSE
ncbi:ABC transporter permease [Adhaeribacter radiodurans]|uniref:ABC transporter permease n=1 Tax=Adhaeribacter radiodurans TaxID=2745197 RepID=A0A7L7L1Q8_9BACT|nr:ABC transporter permease [Adhaeribacter radiodurans]QMU26713.1 ABC transporter permease [Adhaeribacter radiodurans]